MRTINLDDKEILLQENKILKEKLEIHVDLWAIDKKLLEEKHIMAKRQYEGENVVQSFESASLNLSISFQKQECLKLQLQLGVALDELDDLKSMIHLRSLQYKGTQKELKLAKKNCCDDACFDMKSLKTQKEACRPNSFVQEAEKDQSYQHIHEELQKQHLAEVEKLKNEQLALSLKHENEVLPLLRERNFVWDQFKRMESGYCSRLKAKTELLEGVQKEIDQVKHSMEELQKAQDEKVVEIAVLKIAAEEAEKEVNKLNCKLSRHNGAGQPFDKNEPVPSQKASQALEIFPDEGAVDNGSSSEEPEHQNSQKPNVPETENQDVPIKLNSIILKNNHDPKIFENVLLNTDQSTAMKSLEKRYKKVSKRIKELMLENENLRSLYAKLEAKDNQRQGKDKPRQHMGKHCDATNRNLNAELDAVATENSLSREVHAGRQLRPREAKLLQTSSSVSNQMPGCKSERKGSCRNFRKDTETRASQISFRTRNMKNRGDRGLGALLENAETKTHYSPKDKIRRSLSTPCDGSRSGKRVTRSWLSEQSKKRHLFLSNFNIPKVAITVPSSSMR